MTIVYYKYYGQALLKLISTVYIHLVLTSLKRFHILTYVNRFSLFNSIILTDVEQVKNFAGNCSPKNTISTEHKKGNNKHIS